MILLILHWDDHRQVHCPQGGVFGAVADSAALLANLAPPTTKPMNGSAAAHAAAVATVPAEPYEYTMPVSNTALIMIDFQRDFMYPGGFGAALGNDVELLKVNLGVDEHPTATEPAASATSTLAHWMLPYVCTCT